MATRPATTPSLAESTEVGEAMTIRLVYTVPEAAGELRIGYSTARERIRTGELRSFKTGNAGLSLATTYWPTSERGKGRRRMARRSANDGTVIQTDNGRWAAVIESLAAMATSSDEDGSPIVAAGDDRVFALIVEGLGAVRLTALNGGGCDRFLQEAVSVARRPVGRSHLARLRQRLMGVLRNEMRLGNVARNLAEVSELPVAKVDENERGPRSCSL